MATKPKPGDTTSTARETAVTKPVLPVAASTSDAKVIPPTTIGEIDASNGPKVTLPETATMKDNVKSEALDGAKSYADGGLVPGLKSDPVTDASSSIVPSASSDTVIGAGVQVIQPTDVDGAALPATPVGAGVAETSAADLTAADASAAATATASYRGPHVTVVGPARGRRRIGRAFGTEPVRIPMGELSEDEVKALVTDKTLAVSVFDF
jgi:hypothetical protein